MASFPILERPHHSVQQEVTFLNRLVGFGALRESFGLVTMGDMKVQEL